MVCNREIYNSSFCSINGDGEDKLAKKLEELNIRETLVKDKEVSNKALQHRHAKIDAMIQKLILADKRFDWLDCNNTDMDQQVKYLETLKEVS